MKRIVALMVILTIALCFAACGQDPATTAPNKTTPPTTASTTAPATTSTTAPQVTYNYRIRVLDSDGNPIEGAYVQFCLEVCNFYQTNAEGVALIDMPIADGYKAHIISLPAGYEGYTFPTEDVYFAPGQTELTLVAVKPAA